MVRTGFSEPNGFWKTTWMSRVSCRRRWLDAAVMSSPAKRQEAEDRVAEGRLAGPALADDAERLAGREGEVDSVERGQRRPAVVAAIRDRQTSDLQQRLPGPRQVRVGGKQRGGVGMARSVVQFVDGRGLDDLAGVHHDGPLALVGEHPSRG